MLLALCRRRNTIVHLLAVGCLAPHLDGELETV